MRIFLAGQPGAGKSTLFDLLAGRDESASSRGSGLRIAHVPVPDPRLHELSAAWKPKKTTPARLEFQDLEQKGGPPWPNISPERREAMTKSDLLLLVVELFADEPERWAEVAARQWREMTEEFVLLDLSTVEKRQEKLGKLLKIGQKAAFPSEPEVLDRCRAALETGSPLSALDFTEEEDRGLRGYGLLSGKSVFPAFNVDEGHLELAPGWLREREAQPPSSAMEWLGAARLVFSAEVERQIQELPEAEQGTFLEAFGLHEPALAQVIRAAYSLAGLQSFFTTGEDEVRAWTVRKGASAPEAAGEIHSDLEKGFVRAEVLAFEDWKRLGSMSAARDQGVLRLEGKEYVVRDGDILNIRSGLAKSRG